MGVDIIIQEDHFSLKYTNSYDLFIITGMDRFSFLIGDSQSNLLVLKSYAFDYKKSVSEIDLLASVKKVYLKEDLLKRPYRSIKLALINTEHTFIPDRLFNAEQLETYLQPMVKKTRAKKNIHIDRLTGLNTRQIYQMDEDLEHCFSQYFPTARFFHVLSPLVLGLQHISNHQKGKKVYVHVRNQSAHIFLFEDNNFLFANSFTYQTDKDFIYFVMLVYGQFKLDAGTVPLYYSGFILEDSRIYHELYRYIRFLNKMPQPVLFNYGKNSKDLNKHFFFDLYSLKLCE